MHERYNPKMRWEIAKKKQSETSTHDNLGDFSGSCHQCGNHSRDAEIYKKNLKSQTTVKTETGKTITSALLPSDDSCKNKIITGTGTDSDMYRICKGTDSGKNKIAMATDIDKNKMTFETENKENEVTNSKGRKEQIQRPNETSVAKTEEDFINKQEKQEGLSDDGDGDSEDRTELHNEEVPKKPVLEVNIPSASISDIEIQLKKLEITNSETKSIEGKLKELAISQPADDTGKLCERSPVGNEKHCRQSYHPYSISSKVLYNGGGIVAEAEAPILPDFLHSTYPSTNLCGNITDSPESINHLLPPPSPEFPFGQESSSPPLSLMCGEEPSLNPLSPMPHLEQDDLDAWLNNRSEVDEGTAEHTEVDGQLGCQEVSEEFICLQSPSSNFINIPPEQNDLSPDFNYHFTSSHSAMAYRQTKSIPSISSPSSGSRYSSEGSPLSSPAPSPGDSFTSKSDTETENETWRIELILHEGNNNMSDASPHPAKPSCQIVHRNNINKFFCPDPVCNRPNCLTSRLATNIQAAQSAVSVHPAQPIINVQPAPQKVELASSTNISTVVVQNHVQPVIYTVPQHPNIQRGPVVPDTIAVSARERIAAMLDREKKDSVLLALAKLKDEQLSKGDEHGDTQLMILIVNSHPQKLECIFAMVSRLRNIPGALEARNAQNQSALLLACLFLPQMPFVARFIAEAMLEKDIPVNEVYEEGNTLLHLLCAKGDSHVNVLAELLSMRDSSGLQCFDVNQHNYKEGAPLHMAVKTHSKKINCSSTIAFLLSQGADVITQERFSGQTALHMAIRESCDPLLVQILLRAAERKSINLVNNCDYRHDTALHYAALRNDVALQQQAKVIELLVRHGAMSSRCGSQGRMPLALVSAERKSEIQRIIHKR